MSYFVNETEIRQKQKNIDSAIVLTLFLGATGAHRFYLGRKLSGSIILGSLILSFGQALWIIIPVVIIEFFQLAVIADRMKKTASPKPSEPVVPGDSILEEPGYVSKSATAHKSETRVTVYDVSEVEVSKITRDPAYARTPQPPTSNEWIKRLELPYERQDLKLPQLRKGIYEVYEQLAEYVDQQLRKRGSSLHKMMHQVPRGQYVYYNNVLYTIFCIAEGEVTSHYSGDRGGYDNSFSYDLLRGRTDEVFKRDIEHYAKQLVAKLPPADDAVKKRYGLTSNGLPVTWWDQEGILRDKYPLTEKHIRILNHTPSRSTKLYEIIEVRAAIFRHYFKVLSVLHKQMAHTTNWPKRMEKYLKAVFDGNVRYVDNQYRIMILNHILKLCEQAIRERAPYVHPLDITKEQATLMKTIPKEAAQAVLLAINNPEDIHLSSETLEILRKQNPTSWKEDTVHVAAQNLSEIIALLKSYQDSDAIVKVAKEIIKKHSDKKAQLIALYAASNTGHVDDWIAKKTVGLIHPDQEKAFRELLAQSRSLSLKLADELMGLQIAPRKRIVLDKSKLALAQDEHARAVNSVTTYLGEDEVDSIEPKKAPVSKQPSISKEALFSTPVNNEIALTSDQLGFVKMILKNENGIDGAEATAYAKQYKKMLNGYIQSVNKALYEKFEDQVILQQDGRIMIEEEYRVAIEELI